ncbi:hypothetical protein U4E84_09620 [Halorubrum sp. AD140]|uniref:hypothetical protein n=1 Tax=Halorubrum sp. AD140 TaxID=3050073 RepID=UPI002ACC747D|nr:hypothetical protein [Halorubrum sp. AD140]MDZ5811601.1 hypothetical protein [Halorubrum sp. AD140]
MMPGGALLLVALLVAAGGVVTVAALWVRNYRETGANAPEATRDTSQTVVAFVSGAVLAMAIAIAELAGLLGVVGDVVAMFPGGVTQLLLGGIAVAGFGGYLELGVVGATLLVVAIMATSTALTN